MTPLFILLILFLAAIETLASYISRVYAEFGKILTREIEENLDAWEELVEPQLGLTREHAASLRSGPAAAHARHHRAWTSAQSSSIARRISARPTCCRNCAGRSRRGAGRRLLQPAFAHAALQPHARPLGSAARLAHSTAAVAHDAHHGLRPLLLLRGLAGRGAGQLPKRRPPSMSRRCSKPAKKKASSKRATATWCAPPSNSATSWCAK